MYIMGTMLRHGRDEQKQRYLPAIAAGELRLQAFGVTEPTSRLRHDAHHDPRARATATATSSTARRSGPRRAEHSDLMLLLARTTPLDEVEKTTDGLSVFLVDMRDRGRARPDDPADPHDDEPRHHRGLLRRPRACRPTNLVGEEGKGFRYILDGMNAERILIAAECIGDGKWFIDRAVAYAKERTVFGRPIGAEPGHAVPDRPRLRGDRAPPT